MGGSKKITRTSKTLADVADNHSGVAVCETKPYATAVAVLLQS